jgi:trimeric autotransporter adhesin
VATYQFSALSDGQSISFNPNADILNFDRSLISAADIRVSAEGANLRVAVLEGAWAGYDVLLQNVSALQLATTNVTFMDGSRLLLGDNTPGTANDNAANSLVGGAGRDQLAGFGGPDTLNGGAGADSYFVSTGDVLVDSEGYDQVFSDVNWTLGNAFEALVLTGTANISATGNNLTNSLLGNAGNNYFNGRGGSDLINGAAGNDTIDMSTGGTGLQGNDTIFGGDGIDTVDYDGYATSGLSAFFGAFGGSVDGGGTGGEGSASLSSIERFVGGAFDDQISGDNGAQYIDGRGGNDTMTGGRGNDTFAGGAGADHFRFGETGAQNADVITDFLSGTDKIHLDGNSNPGFGTPGALATGDGRFWAAAGATGGHDADDRFVYNTTTRQLFYDADGNGTGAAQLIATLQSGATLAATDLVVDGTPGGQTINGTAGDDSITGTDGNDTINGLGGNDTLSGAGGADRLDGGAGNDSLVGGSPFDPDGADVLIGGDGNDTLNGDSARFSEIDAYAETLDGGLGDDSYVVDNPNDVLIDAGGIDSVRAVNIDWTLAAGFENLHINNDESESLAVGIGNDLDNFMRGGWGVRLEGLGGNDTLMGTARPDTLLGGDGNDVLDGGENIDQLEGGAGNDSLYGSFGEDALSGGAGDDWLDGDRSSTGFSNGSERDSLTGGAGADNFVFGAAPDQFGTADTITDFASAVDALRFDAAAMPALGASGRFAAGDARFFAAAGATSGQDADDRLVYNTTTRDLYFDPDGSGSQAAIRIVTLQPGASLAATDIIVDNGTNGMHIVGTAGNDTLTGGDGSDTIEGLAGNDYIEGRGGEDSVSGGDGNDTLWGADPANYHLYDWEATDTLDGGFGDDVYHVRGDDAGRVDTVMPDPGGIDTIHAYDESHWTLAAGFENVVYHPFHNGSFFGTGNELNNRIDGGAADYSELRGMGGNDTLVAGAEGGSLLEGGDGNDVLQGSFDHGNSLDGGSGVDTMTGGAWDDVYYVTAGDVVNEGAGNGVDTVNAFASWTLGNNFENLTLLAGGVTANGNNLDNVLRGNDANNTSINGRAGNDTMFGMGGNDTFDMSTGGTSSYGNDVIDGGAGADSFEFGNNARSAVNINLTAGTASGGGDAGAGSATLAGIENALGGNFNDSITGSSGANLLRGSNGNDTLNGKAGVDQLNGGAGNDAFVFDALGSANADTVQDFASGADKLQLENAVMTAIGATGNFAAGDARFWSSTAGAAHDANDRVVYDTDGGQLWYDADGSGSGAAQLVATLQGHPALAAVDIVVI